MLELFPAGFEEGVRDEDVELAGYGPPDASARLRTALTNDAPNGESPDGWVVTARSVKPGWDTAWQRFHQPVVIDDLWIGAPWHEPDPELEQVTITPGMAFGTGAHPTTRLCVELLLEQPRGPLLDLGCGSGVVSVVGARMGFDPVTAIDLEGVAVEETRANARRNGVRVRARVHDVCELGCSSPPLVTANLPADVLGTCLNRIQPACAIASGFPAGQAPSLPEYRVTLLRERAGWGAAVLVRAAGLSPPDDYP
jgi:ribosomal protein L11 methyltransferase